MQVIKNNSMPGSKYEKKIHARRRYVKIISAPSGEQQNKFHRQWANILYACHEIFCARRLVFSV